MIRKTLAVTVTAAAAALVFAPLAQADSAPVDVSDRFVSIDAPDAFGAKGDLHLIVSEFGASGSIWCTLNDADAPTSCVQVDAWGDSHGMQRITNIGERAVWTTVGAVLPGPEAIPMGSFQFEFVTSLGAIGLGMNPGSNSGSGSGGS